jgi:hypothetical protein
MFIRAAFVGINHLRRHPTRFQMFRDPQRDRSDQFCQRI